MLQNPGVASTEWSRDLPVLAGRLASLREPGRQDVPALVALLSIDDAASFGVDERISIGAVERFLERVFSERSAGRGFTYAISTNGTIAGLMQVRQLDPAFDAAEWECTIAPAARGTGLFVEAAHLVGSFAFGTVGVRRLESRVALHDGRANGALRKLGAVEEGVLRRAVRRGEEYVDQILWAVLLDDWRGALKPAGPLVH
jgi:RimJ/RimL family protein N-acetyltransferase